MQIIDCRTEQGVDAASFLFNRSAFTADVDAAVAEMIQNVRENGNQAVAAYAAKFDNIKLSHGEFRISDEELAHSGDHLEPRVKSAIELAAANIADFSAQRLPEAWSYNPRPGVTLGERFAPLDRVAAYIPGGTAPLVSTVLHTITMARVAGVKDLVVTSPPTTNGRIHPAILYAAKVAGATEVYQLGGVYAVAALAYGTETIQKVDKIVGPGNAYVTAAKRQVYGQVAIDLVAGPSEVLIIADESANPAWVAADLLAQAEHGSGKEQAILVTTDESLGAKVLVELDKQFEERKRQATIREVLKNGVFTLIARDYDHAVELSNLYAPEHLEVHTVNAEELAPRLTHAGAVFIGEWTPEPIGDFTAGPSHVLPTGGAAKYFNGLTVDQFFRRISQVQYTEESLLKELDALETFGEIEELDAHARAVSIRANKQ
ncbi:MAG: histidinol dehydrogenase [Lentisphaeria bacterium]|nr:histidinol dehydrogenase [Lentisphaeria bacterium]